MPKQDVGLELFYDGAWHDLVSDDDVFTSSPIVIKRGQSDEGSEFRPCTITCTLANDDDLYRTSNPMSPLYGKAGLNTPLRASVAGNVRGIAEASSWAADQDPDFRQFPRRGRAWVDVDAGGVLQRVGQWTEPLRSALYRFVDKGTTVPAEWWPMEDVEGSYKAVSAGVGGAPMEPVTTVRYTLPDGSNLPPGGAPDFAKGSGIPGSANLVNFQGGGTLSAPVRTSTFNGYAIDWVMQFQAGTDAGGTTSADVLKWYETGTYVEFTVNVVKGSVSVFHADAAAAAALTFIGGATASIDPYDGAPHHYRYQVYQSGADYKAALYVDSALWEYAENAATPGHMAGTVGQPYRIEWNPGEARGDFMPTSAGHLIIWRSGQIGDQPPVFYAINGYTGELAAYRFARLLSEEGIGFYTSVGFAKSMPMGPQRPDTLPNLLKEIVDTEDGLLYDHGSELKLFLLCRADRYNRPPDLTLTPTDLPALPREVNDDQGRANVVTASQRDGGDITARDDTGPLGTQPPPNGISEAKKTVNVNVYTPQEDLPQVANWWLRKGTVNLPRFPQLTVDLSASPHLIAAAEAVDVGSIIEITGFREYTVRLHVLGWTETIGTHKRLITFTCAPDQQFKAGVLDTNRLQARYTVVLPALDATSTTLTLFNGEPREQWRPGPSGVHILIGGEEIILGTIGARTGSNPYSWTVTGCTRSVNGVVKSHSITDLVKVIDPIRLTL